MTSLMLKLKMKDAEQCKMMSLHMTSQVILQHALCHNIMILNLSFQVDELHECYISPVQKVAFETYIKLFFFQCFTYLYIHVIKMCNVFFQFDILP